MLRGGKWWSLESLAWISYSGDRWRLHRRLTHMGVSLQQVRSYRSFQNDEGKVVAYNLLSTPKAYVDHFERYAASVVSIIGFGRRIVSFMDPTIREVIAVMQLAGQKVPGKKFPMMMEGLWCGKPYIQFHTDHVRSPLLCLSRDATKSLGGTRPGCWTSAQPHVRR